MSSSPVAILYNDRAVLENHHASAAFKWVHDTILFIYLDQVFGNSSKMHNKPDMYLYHGAK
jgi:hypothetical protein